MATVTNFNNENLPMMNVDVVMSSYEQDEPTPFFELEFLEGHLKGRKLLLGEFGFEYEDVPDGEVSASYSVAFEGESQEANDEIVADNVEFIREIVSSLLEEVARIGEEQGL